MTPPTNRTMVLMRVVGLPALTCFFLVELAPLIRCASGVFLCRPVTSGTDRAIITEPEG